jgi:hypothetical protein
MDAKIDPRRSALMSRIRSADTQPEMAVRRLLHAMGYRFRLHPPPEFGDRSNNPPTSCFEPAANVRFGRLTLPLSIVDFLAAVTHQTRYPRTARTAATISAARFAHMWCARVFA